MAAQLLKSVKLSDLLAARDGVQVITLEHNANIGEALDTLFREGIQSAPVLVGSTVEDGYDGGYLGMADVATILSAYVQGVLLNCDSGDKEKTIKEKSEEFMYRLLITVVGRDASLYYKGEGNHTLFEVITNCYLSDKTHRVALFNEHGAISAIITQFDVVKFLYENIDQLGEASALTLSQLGIGPKEVVTVGVDTTASETLILLATRGLSGVVVLNRDGRMIANVSASDFTGITNYERLSETLGLFLEIDKIEKLEEIYVVTIKPDSTLRETLELYVNESIHRLYMSDDLGRPTGVVTMT
eukprot:Ihof_evm2s420 gene=Ihof_evmTU2s420